MLLDISNDYFCVFQYMINGNVIFRAHMEQLVQDNPLNVEDRHKAKFPLWFKKKVSNLKTQCLYTMDCPYQAASV